MLKTKKQTKKPSQNLLENRMYSDYFDSKIGCFLIYIVLHIFDNVIILKDVSCYLVFF